MANRYAQGRKAETKVARNLRGRGAHVKLSPGSRGSADLKAKFPTGAKWNVQVKPTNKKHPSSVSSPARKKLIGTAGKERATPVIAEVIKGATSYTSARSGRRLNPPRRK